MSDRIPASAALARFTVLDLTRARSGPAAARILADWGAEVIKIERPGEDNLGFDRDGSDFQNLNRNKLSLALDLKRPEGRDLFRDLAAQADVVIENYRPEVKHRLGIDYDSLRVLNPRLIYASISGFGEDGPYRDRPGLDQIAQGMSGLMSVTGLPGQGPVRAGAAVADIGAGLYAAIGVLVALLAREATGAGQWVRTSLLESMLAIVDFQAVRWLVEGEVPGQAGNDHPTSIPTGAFATADGPINIAASGDTLWRRFCEAIGGARLLEDPAYADDRSRARNRVALNAEIATLLATRPGAEWIEILSAAGVPCGPIYAMDEVFADPQMRHLGMVEDAPRPGADPIPLLREPVRLGGTPGRLVRAAPAAGADGDAVLARFGIDPARIDSLRKSGVI